MSGIIDGTIVLGMIVIMIAVAAQVLDVSTSPVVGQFEEIYTEKEARRICDYYEWDYYNEGSCYNRDTKEIKSVESFPVISVTTTTIPTTTVPSYETETAEDPFLNDTWW